MEEAPLEAAPTFAQPKRKINKRFIYLALAILALIIIFFAFKTLGSSNKGNINDKPEVITPTGFPTETSIPSPSDSPTNTPTPKPTVNPVDKQTGLDRSELSVTVQNGSGEAGVASKGSDTLKNLGYNVIGIENADNFEYVNVSIQVKSGKSDYLNLLKK